MPSLLIVGNINAYTFVNAILAAQVQALDHGERGLDDIFVLHSPESDRAMGMQSEWRVALARFP